MRNLILLLMLMVSSIGFSQDEAYTISGLAFEIRYKNKAYRTVDEAIRTSAISLSREREITTAVAGETYITRFSNNSVSTQKLNLSGNQACSASGVVIKRGDDYFIQREDNTELSLDRLDTRDFSLAWLGDLPNLPGPLMYNIHYSHFSGRSCF